MEIVPSCMFLTLRQGNKNRAGVSVAIIKFLIFMSKFIGHRKPWSSRWLMHPGTVSVIPNASLEEGLYHRSLNHLAVAMELCTQQSLLLGDFPNGSAIAWVIPIPFLFAEVCVPLHWNGVWLPLQNSLYTEAKEKPGGELQAAFQFFSSDAKMVLLDIYFCWDCVGSSSQCFSCKYQTLPPGEARGTSWTGKMPALQDWLNFLLP